MAIHFNAGQRNAKRIWLNELGIDISARHLNRLLKQMGLSLTENPSQLSQQSFRLHRQF